MFKKIRRKIIRQKIAQERDKKIEEEEALKQKDPNYQKWLTEQENLEKFKIEKEEWQHKLEEKEWLEREKQAQIQFKYEQEQNRRIEEIKRIEREKIQKEFEEIQKIEKLKKKKKIKQQKEASKKQLNLIQKLHEYSEGKCEIPIALKTNFESNPDKELCPFFSKTGVCRHNHLCNKNHIKSGFSRIILLHNFFQHIQLNEIKNTEYGNDIQLEFSEYELNKDYSNFFDDICYELEKFGKIINIRTAKNCLPHLRGNVYCEYNDDRSAMKAYLNLQGRFYACKQINVEFCNLISWKSAVCGLSFSNNCTKGKMCNYLHIFKNPGDKYNKSVKHDDLSVREENQKDFSHTSWNEIDNRNDERNWRWSESPEKNGIQNQLNQDKNEKNVEVVLPVSDKTDRRTKYCIGSINETKNIRNSSKLKKHDRKERKRSKSKRSSSPSRKKKYKDREKDGKDHSGKRKKKKNKSKPKSRRRSRSRSKT